MNSLIFQNPQKVNRGKQPVIGIFQIAFKHMINRPFVYEISMNNENTDGI